MRPMQFPSILAFVEGSMEQLFINNNFHYVEVVPVNNGISWSVDALCQQISTFFSARNSNADAFIVWVDRENRQETAAEVETAIRLSLEAAGAAPEKIHIVVSDKMTENIILSDEVYIRAKFDLPDYEYSSEGTGGKGQLKALFRDAGFSYRETMHGVACLKAIRLSRCRSASPPVERFLSTFQLPCWWIDI